MLERIDNGEATPMDLEIMSQVQENILGNCLCVLGDSMAMPIGSMIKHFREEFEQHIEKRRAELELEELPHFGADELAAAQGAGAASWRGLSRTSSPSRSTAGRSRRRRGR